MYTTILCQWLLYIWLDCRTAADTMLAPINEQLITFVYSFHPCLQPIADFVTCIIVLQWAWASTCKITGTWHPWLDYTCWCINWLLTYFKMSRHRPIFHVHDITRKFQCVISRTRKYISMWAQHRVRENAFPWATACVEWDSPWNSLTSRHSSGGISRLLSHKLAWPWTESTATMSDKKSCGVKLMYEQLSATANFIWFRWTFCLQQRSTSKIPAPCWPSFVLTGKAKVTSMRIVSTSRARVKSRTRNSLGRLNRIREITRARYHAHGKRAYAPVLFQCIDHSHDYSHTFIDLAFKIPPVFTPLKS